MPVTKTAKRALRSSRKKALLNKGITAALEIAIRKARKAKSEISIKKAISLSDRAAKTKTIHKNKANRIKSRLTKLLPKKSKVKTVSKAKESSKKK